MLLYFVLQCLTAMLVNVIALRHAWWLSFFVIFIGVVYYKLQSFYRAFAM